MLSKKKKTEIAAKIRYIIRALEREYGLPTPDKHKKEDTLEELVRTILSQNTNDVNRDRAMDGLYRRFSTWEEVAKANPFSIEAAIRIGGLAGQKSRRIKEILRWVNDTFGEYSLEGLGDLPPEKAYDMLIDLKGVGPKTASIVMLFSLGKPYFPVDTHIHRVTTRLELIPEGTDANKAHEILGKLFPKKEYYPVHINIITHGRRVCSARNPKCSQCVIKKHCPWPGNHPNEHN